MAAYAVCLYNVWDHSWPPKYKEPVTRLIAKHGGRYIARRSTCPWEMLEGTQPDITGVTLIEFPTMPPVRLSNSVIWRVFGPMRSRLIDIQAAENEAVVVSSPRFGEGV